MKNWYTDAAPDTVRAFVENNPDMVIFGEVFGPGVQKGFDYGEEGPTFRAFDVFDTVNERYLPWDEFEYDMTAHFIPIVPELYRGPFYFDHITELAEGKSTIGGSHVREGVVISLDEPSEVPIVRQLKCVGVGYYEKSE
jgi:RNA ligase (TIGR02306 family)